LGHTPADLADLIPVPDDLARLLEVVAGDDRPFQGAHVPLVVHQPPEAERTFDAGEWAADLIRSAAGRVLVLTPYAQPDEDGSVSARQWNHTAAMIERLDGVCRRFAIELVVPETTGDHPSGRSSGEPAGGVSDQLAVHHLLDAGHFIADGYRPVRLVCPERTAAAPPGVIERVREFLGERT
jgi:hypothetical protein